MMVPTFRLGERGWLIGQGLTGVPARLASPTTSGEATTGVKLSILKAYHDQTMAEGVRVQIVLPRSVAESLRQRAAAENRTVSSLGAYLIEAGLRSLPPLSDQPGQP